MVSPWLVVRGFSHDFLSLYYSVPLGAALAVRLWLNPKTAPWQISGIVASLLIIATSGLYYAFFSLMFIAFVGVVSAASHRNWNPIKTIVIWAIVVFPLLVVTGYGSGLVDVVLGIIKPVKRLAGSQLVFGLNFAEATHLFDSVPSMQWVHQEYIAFWPYLRDPHNLPDWPGLALTSVIFASPLLLAIVAGSSTTGRRLSYWASTIFIALTCIVFGVIYSMEGGLAYYFSLFVQPSIRATDRVIPFLSFFALVVVLATVEICLERRESVGFKLTAAGAIAALAASMTLPRSKTNARDPGRANLRAQRRRYGRASRAGVTNIWPG